LLHVPAFLSGVLNLSASINIPLIVLLHCNIAISAA